eukprot:2840737-Rhodomonas_salina.1
MEPWGPLANVLKVPSYPLPTPANVLMLASANGHNADILLSATIWYRHRLCCCHTALTQAMLLPHSTDIGCATMPGTVLLGHGTELGYGGTELGYGGTRRSRQTPLSRASAPTSP